MIKFTQQFSFQSSHFFEEEQKLLACSSNALCLLLLQMSDFSDEENKMAAVMENFQKKNSVGSIGSRPHINAQQVILLLRQLLLLMITNLYLLTGASRRFCLR